MARRFPGIIAAGALLALVAAGCGGGQASRPAAPAVAPAATAALPAGAAATSASAPAGAAAPASAAPQTFPKPERDEVKIIYGSVTGSMTPLWLAEEKGLFERQGLHVDVQHAESTVGVAAIVAGDAHININEGVTVTRAVAGGVPLRIIAYFNKMNPYAVVARPEIRTPADLRGKAIALLRPADTTDISARMALKPYGIVVGEDVQPLQSGNSPSRLATLLTGQVAAALLSEAFVDRAVAEGMHLLVSLEKEKLPYISTGTIIRDEFGKANPNTVMAFLRAMIEGTRMFNDPANREEVLPVMAKQIKRDPTDPAVLEAYDFYYDRLAKNPYPDREGAETLLDALRSIDPALYGSMTPEQILDPSYMSAIQASGFIDQVWSR
jgi:NitT/TauT family transport system substrate-binding protein